MAVRPANAGVDGHGLSQSGDTAAEEISTPVAEKKRSQGPVEDPDQADDQDQQVEMQEEEDEGQEAKVRKTPKGPTQKEREEHEATHIPYRDWCQHCVRGRAINKPHRAAKDEEEEAKERKVPKVSMDYFFIGQEGDRATEYPMIVMVDESTDSRYMRAVGKKGLGEGKEMEWLIRDMDEELKSWGYTGGQNEELILKSDGENSIKAVRDALGRYHGGKVTPEQPPPGESQSNGRVEEAGKTIRGIVRTHKDRIEHQIGEKLPTDAVILQWLIRWAAMLHSRYSVGKDGKTAYQRQTGRRCRMEVVPFGEVVHYRRLDGEGKNKLESQWEEGVWLGHARGSNEALIGTDRGVVRAWAVKRRIAEEKWQAAVIRNMQGTPARPNPQMPGQDVPIRVSLPAEGGAAAPTEPPPARNESVPRRTYLKPRDFEKHGYTEGCEGCRRVRTGGMGARPHTEQCRARMEEALKQEGNPRHKRAEDAADEKLWEEIKKMDPEARASESAHDPGQPSSSNKRPRRREGEAEGEEKTREEHEGNAAVEEKSEQRKRTVPEEESAAQCSDEKRIKPTEAQGQKRDKQEGDQTEGEEAPAAKRRTAQDPGDTDIVQAILRVDVAEVYSPPRVTEEAKKYGLKAGEAMDLTTGWDFRREEDRRRARRYLEEKRPKLLIGSPMCTMFSPLQRMTPWSKEKERRWTENRLHLQFVASLYEEQAKANRYFLHEHPAQATSWALEEIRKLRGDSGVFVVTGDQCMYGLTTKSARKGGVAPAKKSTTFMTNSYHIARELDRRCDGTHAHQKLIAGRAMRAERYPPALCRAICRGLIREERNRAEHVRAVAEVSPCEGWRRAIDPGDFHDNVEETIRQLAPSTEGGAWDDVTGMPLDSKRVRQARKEEVDYIRSKKVWTKIPRAEAQRRGLKVIKTKWIDINKGDDDNPVYRSRFVAKEYNDGEAPGLFAGTPPLEAMRYIIHRAATRGSKRKVVMINDVARAFFEAQVRRQVCVEIPEEDKTATDSDRDMVGLLNMSLYGTRDAAKNWQEEVARSMKKWGFMQGVYNPCLYHHPVWGITTLVHGDDFISEGDDDMMNKFRVALEARFKIKTQMVGLGGGEEQSEARALNRVIRATEDGWEYEPDQRHIDLLIDGLGLQQAKGVSTPGEEEKKWEEEENKQELGAEDARKFRGHAARLNYLAADRPDIAYSVKEVCREMARPTRGSWKKLKRIVRYLVAARRTIMHYPWQGEEEEVETYTDSDWAGCRRTGKSTSGGAITIGEHFIKSWSSTQASITLSSAEAELVAMTKATAETMGVMNMIMDLGAKKRGVVYADSAAALAIADRKGSGKLRHINVRMLWIQEKQRKEEVEMRKISGQVNPSDLLTKYMPGPRVADLMRRLGQRRKEGRARTALDIQRTGTAG